MALIESEPRSASVRAASEVLLMELTRLEFDRYLVREPAALRALIETLSGRIRADLDALADDMRHCLTPLAQVEDDLAELADGTTPAKRGSEVLDNGSRVPPTPLSVLAPVAPAAHGLAVAQRVHGGHQPGHAGAAPNPSRPRCPHLRPARSQARARISAGACPRSSP